jgi:hypothetical protein
MRYSAAVSAALIMGFTYMQSCPAPVWAMIPSIASIVASIGKTIVSVVGKRDLGGDAFEVEAVLNTSALDKRATCVGST